MADAGVLHCWIDLVISVPNAPEVVFKAELEDGTPLTVKQTRMAKNQWKAAILPAEAGKGLFEWRPGTTIALIYNSKTSSAAEIQHWKVFLSGGPYDSMEC